MPPYWRLQEGGLMKAKVWGMMTSQEYIRGNLSMTLFMRKENQLENIFLWKRTTFTVSEPLNSNQTPIGTIKNPLQGDFAQWLNRFFQTNGPVDVYINVNDTHNEDYDLKLEVEITDALYGSTSSGFAVTHVASDALRIRFITDGIIPYRLAKPFAVSVSNNRYYRTW